MSQLVQKHATKFRFALVGGLNTIIDFGILFLLTNLFSTPRLPANIVSTSVAFVFSFFTNKKFTFRKSGNKGIVRELILFTVITLFGLWVIQSIIIAVLTPVVLQVYPDDNIALLVSKSIATVASMIWNYVLYQRVVFKISSEK